MRGWGGRGKGKGGDKSQVYGGRSGSGAVVGGRVGRVRNMRGRAGTRVSVGEQRGDVQVHVRQGRGQRGGTRAGSGRGAGGRAGTGTGYRCEGRAGTGAGQARAGGGSDSTWGSWPRFRCPFRACRLGSGGGSCLRIWGTGLVSGDARDGFSLPGKPSQVRGLLGWGGVRGRGPRNSDRPAGTGRCCASSGLSATRRSEGAGKREGGESRGPASVPASASAPAPRARPRSPPRGPSRRGLTRFGPRWSRGPWRRSS